MLKYGSDKIVAILEYSSSSTPFDLKVATFEGINEADHTVVPTVKVISDDITTGTADAQVLRLKGAWIVSTKLNMMVHDLTTGSTNGGQAYLI